MRVHGGTKVDTEVDEHEVEQEAAAATAPAALATRVVSARIKALYDDIFDSD